MNYGTVVATLKFLDGTTEDITVLWEQFKEIWKTGEWESRPIKEMETSGKRISF